MGISGKVFFVVVVVVLVLAALTGKDFWKHGAITWCLWCGHLGGGKHIRLSELQYSQQSPVHPASGNQVIPIKVACVVY